MPVKIMEVDNTDPEGTSIRFKEYGGDEREAITLTTFFGNELQVMEEEGGYGEVFLPGSSSQEVLTRLQSAGDLFDISDAKMIPEEGL